MLLMAVLLECCRDVEHCADDDKRSDDSVRESSESANVSSTSVGIREESTWLFAAQVTVIKSISFPA